MKWSIHKACAESPHVYTYSVYFLYVHMHIIIIIIIQKICNTHIYPPCWVLKARIQKHWGKPLLFHDKCPGFFYVHYTTHGTYSSTIMVNGLAQGHKHRDRPGQDSNPHYNNIGTWVQSTRPLGHDTPSLWMSIIMCKAIPGTYMMHI